MLVEYISNELLDANMHVCLRGGGAGPDSIHTGMTIAVVELCHQSLTPHRLDWRVKVRQGWEWMPVGKLLHLHHTSNFLFAGGNTQDIGNDIRFILFCLV